MKTIGPADIMNQPKKTKIYCFHCCHSFDTQPLCLPIKYNSTKNEFHVQGNFCSWECMKAYNVYGNNKSYINSLILLLYQEMNKTTKEINIAPPRETLKIFGGTKNIKDFRKDSSNVWNISYPPLIDNNPKIEKNTNYSWVKNEDAKQTFEMFDSSAINHNSLKVSKPNTEEKQNTLDLFFTCNDV